MKYIVLSLLFSVVFIACHGSKHIQKSNHKKQVFLFAGQSNMDGRADADQLSDFDLQRLEKVAPRISFYYNHRPVTPLQVTSPSQYVQNKFNLTKCFGPELFFGIEIAEKYPEDEFIFIKRAKGGTSLYGCWNPSWTEEKAALMGEENQPQLFSDFIQYVKDVLALYEASEYEIKGMLWVQGEADSGVKKWGKKPAEAYGQILQLFIRSVRDDLSASGLPFAIFQVGAGKVVKGMQQNAQRDKNVFLIPQSRDRESSDFYAKNPPPIGHYTAKSMKRIGVAFFEVFDSLRN